MPFWNNISLQPEPKASSEPINKENVFSKDWYLFLNSVMMALAAVLAALQRFFGIGPTITDTHANKLKYAPGDYPRFLYYETDRQVFYESVSPMGLVDTSGTAVTRPSANGGAFFTSEMAGNSIKINGISYVVSSVSSPVALTLGASAGTQSGVPYQASIFSWIYVDGMFTDILANLPGDLGINDVHFDFYDKTYEHVMRWNGAAWHFKAGESSGFSVPSMNGAAPYGGVWQLCDGSTVLVSVGDGTTASVTTAVLNGDTFIMGSAAQTTVNAGARPAWETTAITDDESTHTHPLTTIPEFFPPTGATANIESLGVTGAGSAHHHKLSNANAQLKVPSNANGGVPQNIGLVWYLRQ